VARALVEQYEPLLRWLARWCGLSAEDGGDTVQVTWLRCLEHIDQLADAGRLNNWPVTICRRECIRLATRARREAPLDAPDLTRLIDDGHEAGDRCAETALRDQHNQLYLAIMALPGRQRTVLVELLRREDQSYLDLSRRLGLPVGSIGPTRQRAFPGCASIPGSLTCRQRYPMVIFGSEARDVTRP